MRSEHQTGIVNGNGAMTNQALRASENGNGAMPKQALRASELSYRRLFETAKDGILILDVDTGRISDVNPFLIKLLGYSHGEMVGQTVGEISPFKDIVSNQAMLERLQKDGYVRYHDLPLETRDGRKIAVEFVSNVYQAGDKKVIQCNIRDITEHKKVENAAIRLAAIIESSDDAIIGKDLHGIITSWNKGAEKLFGYSADEMTGTSMIRLIPADRQDEENQILEKIRHGESMRNFETVWQARDGRWIDVSVTVSPIKDSTGKIVGASEVARDITERKQAEAALRQSEEQFRLITENLADLVAVLDPDGRRLYNSPSYREILGDPDKLRGSSSFDQVHPEDRARVQQAFQETVRTGVGQRLEYRLVSQDGRARYIESQGNVIRDAQGRVFQVVVVSRDVTERREAERALRWSETQLKTVLESTADGILAVDSKGKVIKANRRFAELWRIPQPLVDAGDDPALLDFAMKQLSDPDAFFKKVQSLYSSDVVDMDTLGFKDGRVFERYSFPMLRNGVITGRVWSFRDITERRKLQAQFIEAQKMEAVGQLAGGVAHDFNNILAVIVGYSNLIQSDLDPDSPLRRYTEEIQHSADRATGLTRQLLIFSRKEKVQPVVLDLNDTVKELEKMLRRLVDEHIEMAVVPGKQTGRIKADPGYIWQVLMNLVVNARDAMPNGGRLAIATRNVTLDGDYSPCGVSGGRSPGPVHPVTLPLLSYGAGSSTPQGKRTHTGVIPGKYVMVSVSDTGTGMTDEVKAHMFEAFFTTKPAGKGTGLGLATCQTIVQQSGGHIDVDSEAGQGTTFKIYFPQVDEPLETDTKFIKAGPLPRGTETLLVVEDQPEVRHLTQRVLEAQGYTVLLAANGQDALHVARDHKGAPIRLVVTDVIMPLMGGKVMAEWLKTTYPDLKILFTSGYADEAMAQHGVFTAGIDFLAKPFTPAALVRKVREVLDQPNAPTANPAR